MSESNVIAVVFRLIGEIQEKHGYPQKPLKDDDKLVDGLGLSSLNIAELVALLEFELESDPFTDGSVSITDISTVGDLCEAYAKYE